MKRNIIFLILLLCCFVIMCTGCTPERPNVTTGKYCVECGAKATHFAGTGWVKSLNQNGELYLCDDCYEKKIEWAEENNRIAHDKWW